MGRRAIRLGEAGKHAEAIGLWELMNKQLPGHPGIGLALGAALLAAGRMADAECWLLACCRRHPRDAAVPRLLGRTLMKMRKRDAAIGAFYHALSIEPEHGETHAELASALFWHRQPEAALAHAVQACRTAITELSLSTYLCILLDLGRREDALAFLQALEPSAPLHPGTLALYRAGILLELDQLAASLAAAREAVRLSPDNRVAQHQLAAALLLEGEMTAESWALYEGRSGLLDMGAWPAERLRWRDQDLAGRTLLVHAEQGLGDTLQFIRYVPQLAALGARVIVAVQPGLVGLLQGTPGAAAVVAAGKLPPFDHYIPLLSVPGKMATTLDRIPPPLPYVGIEAQPARDGRTRPKVGIVWAGRPEFIDDRKRSLPPELLRPLAGLEIDFVGLQLGATAMPLPGMVDALEGVSDWTETARRIAALDLVVSVDTAVAHLAATMGKPVWLLARHNGCWRWLQRREDSPWYPSVRLFRQPGYGDWAAVIAAVRVELERFARSRFTPTVLAA